MTLLNSITPIFGILGGFSSGYFADKFGRRKTLMFLNLVLILASLLLIIKDIKAALIGRMIQGVGCGFITSIIPLFMNEIALSEHKGYLGISTQFFVKTAIFINYFLGFGVSKKVENNFWMVIMLFPIIVLFTTIDIISIHF